MSIRKYKPKDVSQGGQGRVEVRLCKRRCGKLTANLAGTCTTCLNRILPLQKGVTRDAAT